MNSGKRFLAITTRDLNSGKHFLAITTRDLNSGKRFLAITTRDLNSGKHFLAITARDLNSGKHFLAITTQGELYSWGFGDGGVLGNRDNSYCKTPTRVNTLGNNKVTVTVTDI